MKLMISVFHSSSFPPPADNIARFPGAVCLTLCYSLCSLPPSLPPSSRTQQQQASEPSTIQAPTPYTGCTAVCLTGSARDFELTGPSIVARLLPSLRPHRPVLFLVAPLDEHSHKLWALQWGLGMGRDGGSGGFGGQGGSGEQGEGLAGGLGRNLKERVDVESAWEGGVELGAVQMGGSVWVDVDEVVGDSKLYDNATARSMQPQLQYLQLLSSCLSVIDNYQHHHPSSPPFHRLIHSRLDSYWSAPPSFSSAFSSPVPNTTASSFDAPGAAGSAGDATAARAPFLLHSPPFLSFSRLLALSPSSPPPSPLSRLLPSFHPHSNLSPKATLQACIESTGIHVARADWPLCTVSHQTFKHGRQGEVLVASLQSRANLNGAKCWPCTPKYTGLEALSHMAFVPASNRIRSPSARPLNTSTESIYLSRGVTNYDVAAVLIHPSLPHLQALSHIAWAPASNRIRSPSVDPVNSDPLPLSQPTQHRHREHRALTLTHIHHACCSLPSAKQALSHMAFVPVSNQIRSPSADPVNAGSNSIQLCDASHPWELAWTDNYDAAAGSRLAGMRRAISSTNLKQYVQLMAQLQRQSANWSAPPPAAICVRSLLGKISIVCSSWVRLSSLSSPFPSTFPLPPSPNQLQHQTLNWSAPPPSAICLQQQTSNWSAPPSAAISAAADSQLERPSLCGHLVILSTSPMTQPPFVRGGGGSRLKRHPSPGLRGGGSRTSPHSSQASQCIPIPPHPPVHTSTAWCIPPPPGRPSPGLRGGGSHTSPRSCQASRCMRCRQPPSTPPLPLLLTSSR
ncbi:unnamed protein product [Closterium sp. NIES-65]|nr:unnamed protein product [Closterium sp. NIES-65]